MSRRNRQSRNSYFFALVFNFKTNFYFLVFRGSRPKPDTCCALKKSSIAIKHPLIIAGLEYLFQLVIFDVHQ